MPLPPVPYEYMERRTAKVSSDYHVRFDNAYYSVDRAYLHKEVLIRASATTVKIFSKEGVFICEWPRATAKSQWSTDPNHLPANYREISEWNGTYFTRKAMAIANLVEPEYQKKMNKRILSRLRSAHLRGCPQEFTNCVDSAEREYLPRGITETLSTLDFIESGLNVCILGPSDSGKSYLAKAIGITACNSYKVEYHHCESLLEALVALKAQDYSKYQKRLKKICGAALLILDDFLLHTITDEREVKILFEILEKRCEINLSTIICSQREPASWSSMIHNDEVSANAILKRATKHYTVVIKPRMTV